MTHQERAIYFKESCIRTIKDLESQYESASTEEEKDMILDSIADKKAELDEINGYLELDELGIEY